MRKRRAGNVVVGFLTILGAAEPPAAHAKRAAPAEVKPVIHAGVRYTVPHFGALHGKDQNGGYVQAWKADTGGLLWDRLVYRVIREERLERDVEDVFITRIEIRNGALRVENEIGEAFAMDLATGKVTSVVKKSGRTALPTDQARLELPTEWPVGSQHRYRATWIRDWLKGAPEGVADSEQKGEVAVTVAERAVSGYRLRWQPELAPDTGSPPAPSDMNAAGVALWREALTLPLDLHFEPKGADRALTVGNAAAVRDRLSGRVRELARRVGIPLDCEGPDAPGLCTLYATEASASAFAVHYAAPLFDCSGLDLDTQAPESWSEPHPDPQFAGLSLRYRREVIDFEARSSQVRVRTVAEPDEQEMRAVLRREAARIGGSRQLQETIEGIRYRLETTCTMDRETGWPLLIERTTRMGSPLVDGAETVRFERLR